jgi:hypothetical protein
VASDDEIGGAPSFDRRRFLKRVAIATAFIAPVVTSFSMDGVSSVFADGNGNGKEHGSGGNSGGYENPGNGRRHGSGGNLTII